MTTQPVRLAIVVVNYGSSELLGRHLVDVAREVPDADIVVVDNHTTVAERARVQALAKVHGWRALLLTENTGFGSGVNYAVAHGLTPGTTHLMLLNPDASIDEEGVRRLLAHTVANPLTLAAPTILTPQGETWAAGADLLLESGEMRGWHRRPDEPEVRHAQSWLSGACLVLSHELWDRTGGFDDDYFLYWEDVDFSRRVLDAGGALYVDPGAVAVHDEGATHRGDTPSRAKSPTYYYYNTRNRLLFAAKHLDAAAQRRWRWTAARAGWGIVMQGGRRQLAYPGRSVMPAVRGTRDGLRLMRERRRRGRAGA